VKLECLFNVLLLEYCKYGCLQMRMVEDSTETQEWKWKGYFTISNVYAYIISGTTNAYASCDVFDWLHNKEYSTRFISRVICEEFSENILWRLWEGQHQTEVEINLIVFVWQFGELFPLIRKSVLGNRGIC